MRASVTLQAPARGCLPVSSFKSSTRLISKLPASSCSAPHHHQPEDRLLTHNPTSTSSRYSTQALSHRLKAPRDWKTILSKGAWQPAAPPTHQLRSQQTPKRKPKPRPRAKSQSPAHTGTSETTHAKKLLSKAYGVYHYKMDATKTERVDLLRRLRDWLDEQQALDKNHSDVAPLTHVQRLAILSLVPPTPEKAEGPTSDNRDTGSEAQSEDDRNWVFELHTHLSKKRLDMPSYRDEGVPSPFNKAVIRWRVSCTLSDGTRFPREGVDFPDAGQPPAFPSKKDAKNFAAKRAYSYVCSNYGVTFNPKTQQSPAVGEPATESGISPSTSNAKRPKISISSPAAEAVRNASTTAGPSADVSAIINAVTQKSISLGMQPPRYDIEPDESVGEGFFKGRAVFSPSAKVPEGLGNKNGFLGKNECKIQVAQAVLEWMQREAQRREELAETLINGKVK